MPPFSEQQCFDESESSESSTLLADADQLSSRRRTVRFNKYLWEHEIMPLDEYSEREKRRCWYTDMDHARHEFRRMVILMRMEQGKPEKRGMTYRGLVPSTHTGGEEMMAAIAKTVNAVMDEQERQWQCGQDDYDRLAETSALESRACVAKALALARQDAQDAIDCWTEEKEKVVKQQTTAGEGVSSSEIATRKGSKKINKPRFTRKKNPEMESAAALTNVVRLYAAQ